MRAVTLLVALSGASAYRLPGLTVSPVRKRHTETKASSVESWYDQGVRLTEEPEPETLLPPHQTTVAVATPARDDSSTVSPIVLGVGVLVAVGALSFNSGMLGELLEGKSDSDMLATTSVQTITAPAEPTVSSAPAPPALPAAPPPTPSSPEPPPVVRELTRAEELQQARAALDAATEEYQEALGKINAFY